MSSKPLEWLWTLALKKAVTRFVQSFLVTYGSALAGAGITVEQGALISALIGLSEFARNWLKIKQKVTWL